MDLRTHCPAPCFVLQLDEYLVIWVFLFLQ